MIAIEEEIWAIFDFSIDVTFFLRTFMPLGVLDR